MISKGVKSIEIFGTGFVLHPSGAIFWKEQHVLLISDVHLGKISHFRKHGSAVSQEAVKANFEKLNAVVSFFKPEKIIFLGDLFHSTLNAEWLLFEEWFKSLSVAVVLIEGNHDIIPPLKYERLGIQVLPKLILDRFLLTHHPRENEEYFNFCGHIHPGVKIKGKGRQQLRLSCFFRRKNQMILPAFGEFTGKHILSTTPQDEIFVIASEEVIRLPKLKKKIGSSE